MFRFALRAACALLVSIGFGSAAAAASVVFYDAGSSTAFEVYREALPGGGKYRIDMTSSIPITFQLGAGYEDHWDTFVAPPPRPHAEYIEGNDFDVEFGIQKLGTRAIFDFYIPRTTYAFFDAPDYYTDYGIAPGTQIYREDRADDPYFYVYADDALAGAPFTYTLTVSAIPEPLTWVMLIAGFGMAGHALRCRRRLRLA